MERRYLAFFAMSFAIILLWRGLFPAKAPVKPNGKQAAADNDEQLGAEQEDAQAQAKGPDDAGAGAGEGAGDDAEKQANLLPPLPIAGPPPADSPHYLTLGSLDPSGPYRLAATLDSHGATIRRVQLSSPKYRDLHQRSGFLGHMELLNSPAGVEVQLVTPGSPAAAAGLQAGDVLIAVAPDGKGKTMAGDVDTAADLERLLKRSEPGDSVQLTIQRGGTKRTLTARLMSDPLDVIRPEAENILLYSDRVPTDLILHPSMELAIRKVEPTVPAAGVLEQANQQLATGVWAVDQTVRDQLTFSMVLPELGIEVIKRFAVERLSTEDAQDLRYPAYHLDVDVEIRNLIATPQTVSYELQGPNGLPIEGFWYSNKVGRGWSGYGIRDVLVRTYGSTEVDFACRNIAKGDIDAFGDGESLAYMGVDAQYFAAAMLPKKNRIDERWYARFRPNLASYRVDPQLAASDQLDGVVADRQGVIVERNGYKLRYADASFLLTSSKLALSAAGEAGDRQTHASTLFTGPKHPELLAEYKSIGAPEYSLDDFVYYGWFGNLGIPQLMVGVLSTFYGIVRNYGLAIVLLTVLVRSCMFPLSRKQAKNMLKMQELKPEMERIAARHKDDAQARTRAQQELWSKHNYNPMGGCLLMFIQLPIFIGLYRALMVDVDLRQAPLIPGVRWCSNLAAPDMLFDWSGFPWPQWFLNGEGMFALGPYLNILPLVTVGLFLLQQKLFMPPAADEQAEMMQKVMKYMMLFMSFLFFKVAAGLCLYFIASSLWGIAERKLIPRAEGGDEGTTAATTVLPSKDAPPKKKRATHNKGKGGGKRKR